MDALLRFCGAKLVAIVPEDWRNAFVIIMGIRYIGVILQHFTITGVKNVLLYRGVIVIRVSLYIYKFTVGSRFRFFELSNSCNFYGRVIHGSIILFVNTVRYIMYAFLLLLEC